VSDSEAKREVGHAPVSGTCPRCGCALGYLSSRREGRWHCCGACAGSGRCTCGCKPELTRERPSDSYVPTRRMFASRQADGLKLSKPGRADRPRAFPFADESRGR
jgi:hypothetical protein